MAIRRGIRTNFIRIDTIIELRRKKKRDEWKDEWKETLLRVMFVVVYLRIICEENRVQDDLQWLTIVFLPKNREFVRQLDEEKSLIS